MTEPAVRAATPQDVDIWRALRREGIEHHPTAFMATPEEAESFPVEVDARRLENGDRFLAFDGDRAVGLIGLKRNSIARARHRAEIGPFYVVAAARGSGIADRLLRAVMDAGQAMGIWQYELFVNIDNARAIAFYTRHGFTHAGEVPNSILGADGPETDALMIRTIL